MQLASIWQHDHYYWGTFSRITPRDGYAIYTNPSLPGRYDPNHAGFMRLDAPNVDAVITDVIHFFDALGMDSVVYLDHLATPTTLPASLVQHGFVAMTDWGIIDLMIHQHVIPTPAPHITVTSALEAIDFATWANLTEPDAHSSAEIMYQLRYQEVSASDVTGYIAWDDGQPAGRCVTYSRNGITRIESVFVAPQSRRRGVARAMVTHAINDSRARGDVVYLFAHHASHAQTLYTSLGMQCVASNAVLTYVRPYCEE
jgi:GNAT superfamily N-acetyltransferase